MIFLKIANPEDLEKEWRFVREMPPDENGLINEWYRVSREDFERKALPQMIAFAEGRDLPEGYVPETFFFLWDGDTIVGQFRIRHWLCESLRTGAGHIGYFIAGLLEGRDVESAMRTATRASAWCVRRAGAEPSIPRRCDLGL